MKACMLAYTFYETDNRVRRYAETLVKRGDEVDAIVLRRPGQQRFEIIEGVRVYRIQPRVVDEGAPLSYLTKLLAFFLRSFWTLTWRHLRQPYQLIHVHSIPDFLVFAALVPRLSGARIILDIHDIVPELYASKFKISQSSSAFRMLVLIEKLSARFSHHVIIANHLWHERLLSRSDRPEHSSTILNYPDPSIFYRRPRTLPRGNEFVLCYPGTLSWHQGVDLIIQAMGRLRERAPQLRLIVLGDGKERENLLTLARQEGVSERVSIGGGVSLETVASTMANVDLGVEPKRRRSFANEALSTKIPEFMAMGVPVLAADTVVHKRYFEGMIDFFESENVDDLAAKILLLAEDPARCEHLREAGDRFIAANNWGVRKHEYLDLVDRLVLGHSAEPVAEPVPLARKVRT